jgi:hypothetical protein
MPPCDWLQGGLKDRNLQYQYLQKTNPGNHCTQMCIMEICIYILYLFILQPYTHLECYNGDVLHLLKCL